MTEDTEKLWKLQRRTVIKVGNSAAVTIHKDEREKLGVEEGDEVIVKVEDDGTMIIEVPD